MIGAIVFILSLLVLGFCVVSPSTTQKIQETAIGAWEKAGIGRGFNNWMLGLRDQSVPDGPGPRDRGIPMISDLTSGERAEGQTFEPTFQSQRQSQRDPIIRF